MRSSSFWDGKLIAIYRQSVSPIFHSQAVEEEIFGMSDPLRWDQNVVPKYR